MAPALSALAVSVLWCVLAVWLGRKVGYVDRPERSDLTAHETLAVPLGGVGIFLAIHLGALWAGGIDVPLLAASAIVLVLGLIDDRVGLSPWIRLVFELVAAVVLVAMAPYPAMSPLFAVLAVMVVVTAINAVNLYDGLDGLAGSSALVSALGLAWLLSGRGLESLPPLLLAAALAGFLPLNWHPAKVFLGDGGAYLIGLALAHLVLGSGTSTGEVLVALGLLGVFAVDLAASVVRRLASGGRLFEGDRRHVYDQLRERGLDVPRVALASAAVQAVFAVAVVVTDRSMTAWAGVVLLMGVMIVVLAALARAGFLRVDSG